MKIISEIFERAFTFTDPEQNALYNFIDASDMCGRRGVKVLVIVICWQLLLLVSIIHEHLDMGDNVRNTSLTMSMCGAQVRAVGDQI